VTVGVVRVPVAAVHVGASSTTLVVGQTMQLNVIVQDAGGRVLTGRSVSWLSSSDAIATVSTAGVVTGATPGSVAISAISDGVSGSVLLTVVPRPNTNPRSATDRPDDVGGNQIHIVYVVPSDGADRGLDTSGVLSNSAGSFQQRLAGQTGGRQLRVDTYQGRLDISFVRLARTNAQGIAAGAYLRDSLEKDLMALGFAQPGKIYATYYDGGTTFACGSGAWPPALPGRLAGVYLGGGAGALPCNANPLATSPTAPPGYLDFAMLHEIMHTLGIVSATAPNHTLSGHVNTSPNDLMYAGPLAWTPSVLDVNRHIYYNPSELPAGIYNLATSPYLLP